MTETIYRTVSLPTLSEKVSAHFLRSLAVCGASIKRGFCVGAVTGVANDFALKQASKHSMFFLIEFPVKNTEKSIQKLESLGYTLSMPEQVASTEVSTRRSLDHPPHVKCYLVTIVFAKDLDWKMMHKIIASGSPEIATSRVVELVRTEWEEQGYAIQFSEAQEVSIETVRGMMDTYEIKEQE